MQHNPTHSQKESNTLKVYHTQSTISSFYDMSAPIQFTLSYCSGLSDKDFFNIMTISPIDQFCIQHQSLMIFINLMLEFPISIASLNYCLSWKEVSRRK